MPKKQRYEGLWAITDPDDPQAIYCDDECRGMIFGCQQHAKEMADTLVQVVGLCNYRITNEVNWNAARFVALTL